MLTDMAIKRLKPKEKIYKVADRDGMYASVGVTGRLRSDTTTGSTAGARP